VLIHVEESRKAHGRRRYAESNIISVVEEEVWQALLGSQYSERDSKSMRVIPA